ncbi:MAG: flavohemoglobin expression-modulating QEGLA motif protein [Wenzhouxiangellaceae bacterium]
MMQDSHRQQHYSAISERLMAATSGIRLLDALSWPATVRHQFLADWDNGRVALPQVFYTPPDLGDMVAQLNQLLDELAHDDDPLAVYLAETARSYLLAAQIIDHAGSAAAAQYSIALYGQPGDVLPGTRNGLTNRQAAEYFANLATFCQSDSAAADDTYDAETSQGRLQQAVDNLLREDAVKVVLDPDLVAKAAAGVQRIRLRSYARFTEHDLRQLIEHEAFVHSLTAINGRYQPVLKVMARSAPRTTGTQEGLATFAELVTGSIDLARLRRISLRITAIDLALQGADFIEVFRFLLDQGQLPGEAFNSAMRVFRGAPLSGGSAFTKDTVYLHGLLSVHTFFRWCLSHQRLDRCYHLFAGRLTVSDVLALEAEFDSGLIIAPRYLPPWMQQRDHLAAYLAFSVFANDIEMHAGLQDDLAQDPVVAPRLLRD